MRFLFMKAGLLAASLWAGLLFWSVVAGAGPTEEPQRVYTFGIVPQFNAARSLSIWKPILGEIEKRTGLKFRLVGSDGIPAFERQFSAGKFDFVYMNPYHFIRAERSQGYIPLVSDVGRKLFGILVVRADSPIRSVRDLEGKLVAFPAPNALGASLMIRADLKRKFGVDIVPRYVRSHSSVYLNVVLGKTAAGGGVQKTLEQQPPAVKDNLRVIYRTQEVISHPIAAHPRVPPKVREIVKQAMLALGETASGRAILAKVPIQRVGSVTAADYAPLAELDLEAFYTEE